MSDTTELRKIAKRLDAWDEAGAARIRAVADALDDPDKKDGWAGVDARDAVALDSIIDRLHERKSRPELVSQLERARNLLVLVPILLTWLGLMYAVSAYSAAVSADPALVGSPFLLLWEQSFGGHGGSYPALSFLTLSTVAFMDVAVICLILALTWFVHGQTTVAAAAAGQQTQELEGRLQAALWSATLEFRSRASMSTAVDRFGRAAKKLLDELKAERTHLEELVNGRERRMNEMRGFADAFRLAATDLSGVSHTLAVSVGASATSADALATSVQQLAARQVALEVALGAVASETATAATSLRDVSGAVEAAMNTVADAASAIGPGSTQVGDSAEVLRREIALLRRDLEVRETSSGASVAAQLAALEKLTSEIESLRSDIRTLQSTRTPDA